MNYKYLVLAEGLAVKGGGFAKVGEVIELPDGDGETLTRFGVVSLVEPAIELESIAEQSGEAIGGIGGLNGSEIVVDDPLWIEPEIAPNPSKEEPTPNPSKEGSKAKSKKATKPNDDLEAAS